VANHVIVITNSRGAITLKKGRLTQSQSFSPPQNIHVVVPYHVDAYYKDKTKTKLQKSKRT
jgi:hypothetical protein